MKIILNFFEYLFVKILFVILSFFSINFVSKLGGFIFQILGPFTKAHKTATLNLKRIFENSSEKEIKEKVDACWNNLGKTIFELSILEKLVDRKNNKIPNCNPFKVCSKSSIQFTLTYFS